MLIGIKIFGWKGFLSIVLSVLQLTRFTRERRAHSFLSWIICILVDRLKDNEIDSSKVHT